VAPSVWIYQPYQEKLDVAREVHRVVLARGEGLVGLDVVLLRVGGEGDRV
jgi:hypothetical protein